MTVLALSWQTVRTRLSGFIGAFLAVLCGTALVGACGVLIESGLRSGVPTERYAAAAAVVGAERSVRPPGADVLAVQQVTERPTVDAGLVDRVAAVPGVRAAVGEVDFAVGVFGADGPVTGIPVRGHAWDSAVLAPFTLTTGTAPASADQVVLDVDLADRAGVAVGGALRVETALDVREYPVVGLVSAPSLARQSAVFFSRDRAQVLFDRPGQVHAVGVLAADGVDADALAERLERELAGTGVEVATGADRSMLEFTDVGQARTLLLAIAGSFAGVALLVMVFVVSSTLALSVAQRRREFALLRAIAATPRQVRALIGAETTLVAAVAGGLGGVAGLAVAGWLRDAFAAIGLLPADFPLALGPLPAIAAALLGVGAARLAAWAAARGPARIPPVAALGEAAVEPRGLGPVRRAVGALFLVGGVGVATLPLALHGPIGSAMAGMSALLIVIGLAVLGPLVVGRAVRWVARPLSRFSPVAGHLAAASSVANTRRLAAATTPLMLAVGFAIVQFFSQSTTADATERQTDLATVADHVITSRTGVLPPEVADAVRGLPGVASATAVVRTSVITADGTQPVEVQTGAAMGVDQVAGTLNLGDITGDLTALTGNTVALSEPEASRLDKAIGDEVPLYLGDGTETRLRLVATYTHDLAFGDVILPADLARSHTTDKVDTSVFVRLHPDADPAVLVTLTDRYPGVVVGDRAAMTAAGDTAQQQQFWVNLVAFGVILGYIVISVANTLVMTTAQRAREFALLRLIGGTRRQVRRMMRTEAVVVAAIAVLIGTLIPVLPLAFLGLALAGNPVPTGPIAVYLAIIGSAAALALLSITIPTRTALRGRPVDVIGLRE
ncbi:FtsX-like permease family protein [Actinokineospora sp. NPDC004072]